ESGHRGSPDSSGCLNRMFEKRWRPIQHDSVSFWSDPGEAKADTSMGGTMKRRSSASDKPIRARSRTTKEPKSLRTQKPSQTFRETLNRIQKAWTSGQSDPAADWLGQFMTSRRFR